MPLFNFVDAMQSMCLTMQLTFTIKSMKTLGVGELTSKQKIIIIDIIDGYKGGGYGVSTQNELGGYTLVRTGLIAFQADDDVIDGCKRNVRRCI